MSEVRHSIGRSEVALALLSMTLLVSACGGGGGGNGNSPPPPPPPPPQAGILQLQASSNVVDEDVGAVTLTITRTGGSGGVVSVSVTSSNGSATAGQDYTSVSTTVSWAAGDATAKSVAVPIADDGVGEVDETFVVTLSAPGGGASVGPNATTSVTIRDDGDPPAAPQIAVGAGIKQLTFSWASVPTATHYRLMQNPDGGSGFTQVGADHAATATTAALAIAVHRHDWVNASYRLEACSAHGCSASAAMSAVNVMLQSIGYFKASNTEASDFFGVTLALSSDGSTLAVGAHLEDSKARGVNPTGMGNDQDDNSAENAGAVYVFARAGATWTQQAYVKASNAEAGDVFGVSLALSDNGSTLAVGAPLEASNATGTDGDGQDNNGAPDAGAVYVFTRDGAQWSQQAYVKASNTDEGDNFGFTLALSGHGNTLAVGATRESSNATGVGGAQDNNGAPGAGAAYVFARTGTQWSQQAYVKASNTQQADEFGSSLALSGDGNTLAVGATGEDSNATGTDGDGQDSNTANLAGAAYVFARNGTVWSQHAYVKASNTDEDDNFGFSVALSGDGNTLAVGARFESSNATGVDGDQTSNDAPRAGAVYVFARGTQWSQQVYVKASNAEADDRFGTSLALSADGSMLAIGAPGEGGSAKGVGGDQTDNTAPIAGSAYVLRRVGVVWLQQVYVKSSNTDAENGFGLAVGLSADGNALAISAPFEASSAKGVNGNQMNNDAPRAGAAYIF